MEFKLEAGSVERERRLSHRPSVNEGDSRPTGEGRPIGACLEGSKRRKRPWQGRAVSRRNYNHSGLHVL